MNEQTSFTLHYESSLLSAMQRLTFTSKLTHLLKMLLLWWLNVTGNHGWALAKSGSGLFQGNKYPRNHRKRIIYMFLSTARGPAEIRNCSLIQHTDSICSTATLRSNAFDFKTLTRYSNKLFLVQIKTTPCQCERGGSVTQSLDVLSPVTRGRGTYWMVSWASQRPCVGKAEKRAPYSKVPTS